jgi:hypothetical protein
MKIANVVAMAGAGFALAGCATMLTGGSEDIAVLTPPVSGASCVLSNEEGSWTVVTPTVAHVQRGIEDLQVKCTKPGYQEAWKNLASHWDGLTWGNVANLGVGFGVDAYTGAIHEYPHSVQLPMQSATGAPASAPSAMKTPSAS